MTDTFYLGIGAPRSGTTWLYHNLRKTSDLYLPPIKELRYFIGQRTEEQKQKQAADILDHPQDDARDKAFAQAWRQTKDGDAAAYMRLFPSAGKIGELSPIYCTMGAKRVEAVKAAIGDRPTKVFMLLRNPFDRDVSHIIFTMHRQRDRKKPYSAEEYIEFLQNKRFRQRSHYKRTVLIWRAAFGENLHLFYYDDLDADPKRFFGDFTSQMGLTGAVSDIDESKANQSGHHSRFQIELPPEVLRHLRRRHLRAVKNMDFLPEARRNAWLETIKAVKPNAKRRQTPDTQSDNNVPA
ncbi:MAG: sulfotransferase [Pseudomonadota bacterium]